MLSLLCGPPFFFLLLFVKALVCLQYTSVTFSGCRLFLDHMVVPPLSVVLLVVVQLPMVSHAPEADDPTSDASSGGQ